jgi:hypothetical protein
MVTGRAGIRKARHASSGAVSAPAEARDARRRIEANDVQMSGRRGSGPTIAGAARLILTFSRK